MSLAKTMKEYYSTSTQYLDMLKHHPPGMFDGFIQASEKHLKKDSLVLDMGCGAKASTALLKKSGYRVIGMDISYLFLSDKDVPMEEGMSFVVADAAALPFKPDCLDAVVTFDAIEHFPDIGGALDETGRVLKQGGKAIVFSPNHFSPIERFLDFMRILSGRSEGKPIFAENKRQALSHMFRNTWITLGKLFRRDVRFITHEPDLTESKIVGGDSDAVYYCHPVDIWKFFKLKGFRVLAKAFPTYRSAAGRIPKVILSKVCPSFYFSTNVIVQKR